MPPFQELTVKYISTKTCFVYFNSDLIKKISTNDKKNLAITAKGTNNSDVIKDKIYFFSYSPSTILVDDSYLYLSPTFGKSLNLNEGHKLEISFIKNPPVLSAIEVTPSNNDDLQIVQLRADKLQEIILQQITIVALKQPIVIWLTKNLNITLYVDKLVPDFTYGKLQQFTEVHVNEQTIDRNIPQKNAETLTHFYKKNYFNLPPVGKTDYSLNASLTDDNVGVGDVCDGLSTVVGNKDLSGNYLSIETDYRHYCNDKMSKNVFRVIELPTEIEKLIFDSNFNDEIHCCFNVLMSLKNASKLINSVNDNKYIFCNLKKITSDMKDNNLIVTQNDNKSLLDTNKNLIVRVIIIESYKLINDNDYTINQLKTIYNDNIFVSKLIMQQMKLKLGSKIQLEKKIIDYQQSVTRMELIPFVDQMEIEINDELFYNYIRKLKMKYKFLIQSDTILYDDVSKLYFGIRLIPNAINYATVDKETLLHLPIDVKNKVPKDVLLPIAGNDIFCVIDSSEFVLTEEAEKILSDCDVVFTDILRSFLPHSNANFCHENILICGDIGTGKTTLLSAVKKKFVNPPYCFYVEIINCKQLKGKKVENVGKLLVTWINESVYRQPSLLLFDDLDCITGGDKTVDNEENTPDKINAARISDLFISIMTNYQLINCLNIIATCTNIDRLGKQFQTTRGLKLIDSIFKIGSLTKCDRLNIIKTKLVNKEIDFTDDIDWDHVGNKTDGFAAQDLVNLVEKTTFVAWKRRIQNGNLLNSGRNNKNEVIIENNDFAEMLNNFSPISLYGVSLFTGSGYRFCDIGSLKDIKNCLIQLLKWPLIYPELFKNAPIRQQSGVLLYGMPGTGKTMIAGAIAEECGLNFINIKGPELLSKYIGASEEAVRDIFSKAQRAKPCVLFFDEFESLAPRRGHDSSGVTDRVVNQLLTQFDGIEGREGVAIVAASSRPDLLDPALLRPGRLDKSLLCPLPQEGDRVEILEVLFNKHGLDSNQYDIKILAKMTNGFTGADLNSILTQAKLNAIDENYLDTKKFEINVNQNHLLEALESTQPSLTASEVKKFTRIYDKFAKGGDLTSEIIANPRATLA